MSTPQQKTVDCNKYSNLVCEDDWVKNLQKFKENLEKGQFYSESTSTGGSVTDPETLAVPSGCVGRVAGLMGCGWVGG